MTASPTMPTLLRLDRGWLQLNGNQAAAERIDGRLGDGVLLEWGADPAGLFELMSRAARAQRVVLPARWLPARPEANGGFGDDGRLLWVARSDGALTRLLSELELGDDLDGSARADEPLVLLGVPGDVVRAPSTLDPHELRRRAEVWIAKLGADRVALALLSGGDDPLMPVAEERGLPILRLADADETSIPAAPERPSSTPLLWTDFQLDREHRLPDDAFVPGLRDLLHRGSLLRERRLYERLPENWRQTAEDELRALYSWHVSPMLRRAAALIQTLSPVTGVEVQAPLSQVGGVCAYLLGLSDRRLPQEGFLPDAETTASQLAQALQEWDRQLVARVQPRAWPRLQSRLAPWVEGGHLATCPEPPSHPGRRFCFSGEALFRRVPLGRDRDGVPRVSLESGDRKALGWFDLQLHATVARSTSSSQDESTGVVEALPLAMTSGENQLDLGLERHG